MCHVRDGCVVLPNLGENDGIVASHIMFGKNFFSIEKQVKATGSFGSAGLCSPALKD